MDLEKFFDQIHHQRLEARLEQRITDRRILRLIHRMLKAKVVMPDGVVVSTEEGAPQGGPLTPPTEWKTFRGEVVYCGQSFERGLGTVGRKVNELHFRHMSG